MKRLIKNAVRVGATVRFKNHPSEKGIFTVINKNEDGTFNIQNESGGYNLVNEEELTDSNNFIVGDKVRFSKHPYDNSIIFEVKEVLPNENYFIESDTGDAFTNINKINLDLA